MRHTDRAIGTLTRRIAQAAPYRPNPVLIKPGDLWSTTLIQTYADIETPDDTTSLDLRLHLLIGSIYAFEVAAVCPALRKLPASATAARLLLAEKTVSGRFRNALEKLFEPSGGNPGAENDGN